MNLRREILTLAWVLLAAAPALAQVRDTVPEPRIVMRKSLMVPGWGQAVNRQHWKIPIVYGTLAGFAGYALWADSRYKGYRAAYYNAINADQRFGPTPTWVPSGQPAQIYRTNRDYFRNQRDLTWVMTGVAWGLNAVDAYIFAHLRDFDVSDDLSARIGVGAEPVPAAPGRGPMLAPSARLRLYIP